MFLAENLNLTSMRPTLRTWWKGLMLIGLTAVALTFLINATKPNNNVSQIIDAVGLLILGFAQLFGTIGLFDQKFYRKNELIQQVRNQVSDEAKSAISQLNAEGYLRDGSLRGVSFQGVRLAGVDLKATDKIGMHVAANLESVNLKQADLGGADMRGINLRGANFDMANLENATLTDADLSNTNFVLTNLKGASFLGSSLNGAKFAGEICDENTQLPNGKKWNPSVNWAEFGAKNDLPEHSNKIKYQNKQQANDEIEKEKRAADLKLLKKLWHSINTDNVLQLNDKTQYRILPQDLWTVFVRYIHERVDHPESHFLIEENEQAFGKFDSALKAFLDELVISATLENWHGQQILQPNYKTARTMDYKVIQQKEKEWEFTIDLLLQVVKEHHELVTYLRHQFPSFNFDDTSGV